MLQLTAVDRVSSGGTQVVEDPSVLKSHTVIAF